MSAIFWLSLVSFACSAIYQGEGSFGYELLESRLENLEQSLTNLIASSSNATNTRLEKLETMDKMTNKILEQNQNGIEIKHSRLIDRLAKLETTGDAILSKQRSSENRINDIAASISTLNSQSKQILNNHKDLVITSCDEPKLTGIYRLQAPNINVFCEMVDRGGRWLYIQRQDGRDVISFERNFYTYVIGFGNLGAFTSFWLGLEALHQITNEGDYELLVGIKNEHDEYREARYSQFKVAGSGERYRLIVGGYSGTAGDKLINNTKFSTFDDDNDNSATKNCANDFHSGWWFDNCRPSNLNGPYKKASNGYGIEWGAWADAAKFSKMMIRRKQ